MKSFQTRITGILFGFIVVMTAAGCAAKPESIAPAYVGETSYANWKCKTLVDEQDRLIQALTTASEAQRIARNNDIAGVILVGLPVSSLSGSNQAAQKTGIKKGCNLPEVQLVHASDKSGAKVDAAVSH